jgi:hypothetical protein
VALVALSGCSASSNTPLHEHLSNQVGYIDLEEREYWLGGSPLRAAAGKLFFAVRLAQSEPATAPLLIVSGGGPAASALSLSAHHTCSDEEDGACLSRLGNVLYIDALNAGFSYPLLDSPTTEQRRRAEFSAANYNVHKDAGDFLMALGALAQRDPWLFQRPIYLLTESYGAARTEVLVDWLLNPQDYADEAAQYFEPALSTSLRQILGSLRGSILLEPWFAGSRQDEQAGVLFETRGSVIDDLATAAGTTYERCAAAGCEPFQNALAFLQQIDRSQYDRRQTIEQWQSDAQRVTDAANDVQTLETMFGVDATALDASIGAARANAYRFADAGRSLFVTRGELDLRYGTPAAWDAYFVPFNVEAASAFTDAADSTLAELLLRNASRVPVFVTRARFDLTVYGPALLPTLASYASVQHAELVAAAPFDRIELTFSDGTAATLLSREYESSHSVSRDAAGELVTDIAEFVAQTAAH